MIRFDTHVCRFEDYAHDALRTHTLTINNHLVNAQSVLCGSRTLIADLSNMSFNMCDGPFNHLHPIPIRSVCVMIVSTQLHHKCMCISYAAGQTGVCPRGCCFKAPQHAHQKLLHRRRRANENIATHTYSYSVYSYAHGEKYTCVSLCLDALQSATRQVHIVQTDIR